MCFWNSASTITGNYTWTSIYRLWVLCWPNNHCILRKATAKLMKTFKFLWKIQRKKHNLREREREKRGKTQVAIKAQFVLFYWLEWPFIVEIPCSLSNVQSHTHTRAWIHTVSLSLREWPLEIGYSVTMNTNVTIINSLEKRNKKCNNGSWLKSKFNNFV